MPNIRMIAYLLASLLLFAALSGAAFAQSWTDRQSSGLTTVSWHLTDNTYMWLLTNNSGYPGDSTDGYDIIIWSLQPFGVTAPISWTAPQGWTWDSDGAWRSFRIANKPEKYSSPPALAPGSSAVFTFTFDPTAPLINSTGRQPEGLAFLAHVAAVSEVPIVEGNVRHWTAASAAQYGSSWHDTSTSQIIPEPSGALVLAIAGSWLITCLIRNRKRAANYRHGITVRSYGPASFAKRIEIGMAGIRR